MVFCGNASKQQNKAYKKFTRRFLTVTYYIFLYRYYSYICCSNILDNCIIPKRKSIPHSLKLLARIVQILNVIAKALPTGRIARIVQIDLSRVSSFLAVKVYWIQQEPENWWIIQAVFLQSTTYDDMYMYNTYI